MSLIQLVVPLVQFSLSMIVTVISEGSSSTWDETLLSTPLRIQAKLSDCSDCRSSVMFTDTKTRETPGINTTITVVVLKSDGPVVS